MQAKTTIAGIEGGALPPRTDTDFIDAASEFTKAVDGAAQNLFTLAAAVHDCGFNYDAFAFTARGLEALAAKFEVDLDAAIKRGRS